MAVMAARAGKDVFCEKPTLNIEQGKILVDAMTIIASVPIIPLQIKLAQRVWVYHRLILKSEYLMSNK